VSCCDNQTEAICPCGTFIHPRVISNPPGLDAISYRVGDYTTFRHALLQARPGEAELTRTDGTPIEQIWRPGASGDLAVQMVEWWAYLADILTFYNERVATQAYLRTADLPESVNRLIRLLGYRPRPGIGAIGVLAALANSPKPFTLPKGFQIQSKPGPGQQPQIFELTAATQVGAVVTGAGTEPQGVLAADPAPATATLNLVPDANGNVAVYLQGATSAVKAGDEVLFLPNPQSAPVTPPFFVGTVSSVAYQKDQNKKPITCIQLKPAGDVPSDTDVRSYRLLTSNQSVQVWPYSAAYNNVVQVVQLGATSTVLQVDLNSIVRAIKPGDDIVFDTGDSNIGTQWGTVVTSTEAIWYANPPGDDPTVAPPMPDPNASPPVSGVAAIPIQHTRISFTWTSATAPADARATFLIRYGWKDAGPLIVPVPSSVSGETGTGAGATGQSAPAPVTLQPSAGVQFPTVTIKTPVLVEDVIGNGDTGILDTASNLKLDDPVPTLVPPLRVLFNLLSVTRGKTVVNEVLGNGNAALAGQDFVLQKTPVTYLQSPESVSGDDYSSTVRVWVNGLEWKEVRSFYGQTAAAQVFVTEEDEEGKTHVLFGDGENGARLPTGVNNVTANYRYGSGVQVPDAGSLTVILQPQPGLKAIRNPVQVGGGSDPDSPTKVRQLAPQSVLTFNRAVSVDDYETIAAQAPGVTRAKAAFAFDATEQRPRVKIWVGDNAAAVTAARSAIAAAADPNRPPAIELATQMVISLSLTLVLDPRRDAPTVLKAVHDALLDPDKGLLGVNVVEIGQAFFDSQIFAACLAVPGVQAVHSYRFSGDPTPLKSAFSVCQCEHRHDPGDGAYFFLPDDGQYLTLTTAVAV
jgi:hypothetical protein